MESPNTLIIYYDETVGKDDLLNAIEKYNATILYEYSIIRAVAIRIDDESKIDEAIDYFSNVNGVLQVLRDQMHEIDD